MRKAYRIRRNGALTRTVYRTRANAEAGLDILRWADYSSGVTAEYAIVETEAEA